MAAPEDRPIDTATYHTEDLPSLPTRDRNIVPACWVEAPDSLVHLGDDIDEPMIAYKRRIGRWLLWRAGPASRADARYLAIDADDIDDVDRQFTFRLWPDGRGEGIGPRGKTHSRFRTWKEALRDSE